MQNSNQFRLLLWAGFFLVAFMLYNNWMIAKNPPPERVATTESRPQESSTPALTNQASSVGSIPAPGEESASSATVINVKTDLYSLQIQTEGGDIVKMGLLSYPESLESDSPYELMGNDQHRFRINQTGLFNPEGSSDEVIPAKSLPNHRTLYHAEKSHYTLEEGEESLTIPLYYEDKENNITYIKRYTFDRGSFAIHFEQEVINNSSLIWQGKAYHQLVEKDTNIESSGVVGSRSYMGPVISFPYDDIKYKKLKYKDLMEKKGGQVQSRFFSGADGWLALLEQYFTVAWIPGKSKAERGYLSTIETFYRQTSNNAKDREYVLRIFDQHNTEVSPGEIGRFESRFYAGPKNKEQLAATAEKLDLTLDFGWLSPISNVMLSVLKFFYGFTGNWGWAIVLLVLLVKAILFLPAHKGYTSMAKMRHMAPKLKLIREQYGDDRMKLQEEMMKLYRTEKINPLGGCWPILIQIPIFIALFWMLKESIELRQTPWILWIKDLSQMDPYFILPALMGVTMFFQQRLNPAPTDPMQAKIFKWMPIAFVFMFMWFASGIVLYWVVNNALTIVQQGIITKRLEAQDKKS